MNYWLLKSEPDTYSWNDLCALGKDHWDGVRNYMARNYLRDMKPKDQAFFYHSGKQKAIVGIVEVVSDSYPDPTMEMPHPWVVVDVKPVRLLERPVPLKELRTLTAIEGMKLFQCHRLSVQPVAKTHFDYICNYAKRSFS